MEQNETLDILELEDSLADIEKPAELPPGLYTGEVQDVQLAMSGKGNRYYSIRFKIPHSEIPAAIADGYEDGATLYWNRQVVPGPRDRRSLFSLRKLIEALGLDPKTRTVDPNEWMGRQARLRVTSGSWQGESRAEIKGIEVAEERSQKKGRK
jgi:hypothetical protein